MAKDSSAKSSKKEKAKTKKPNRVVKYFRDLKSELKKVVWPSKSTVIKNTSVALAVMAVAAIAIWGFDQIAQLGVKALINLVG